MKAWMAVGVVLLSAVMVRAGVVNGGFEETGVDRTEAVKGPRLRGWESKVVRPGTRCEVMVVADDREGEADKVLRVETDGYLELTQDVALKKGQWYRLSLWSKMPEGYNPAVSLDPVTDGKLVRDYFLVYATCQAKAWTRYEFDFVATQDGAHRLMLAFIFYKQEGGEKLVSLMDDVAIEPIDAAATAAAVTGERSGHYAAALDFGDLATAVQPGYQPVTPATMYEASRGYGFEDIYGLAANRWGEDLPGNALSDDMLWSKQAGNKPADHTLRVDVPDGEYFVRLLVSSGPHFAVEVSGGERFEVRCAQSYNLIAPIVLRAKVTDRALRVRFTALPTTSSFYLGWTCHGVVVYAASDRAAAEAQIERDEAAIFLASGKKSEPRLARVDLAPAAEKPVVANEAEQHWGYVLFTRSYTGGTQYVGPVFPTTVPEERERAMTLSMRAAPGESEPVLLGVYPLREVKDVAVAAGIEGLPGARISVCDIGFMRFKWEQKAHAVKPIFLTPVSRLSLEGGQCRGLWVTVDVPADAKAGTYHASVYVGLTSVPLTVEVLPIKLLEPEQVSWGVYYDWGREPKAKIDLADMRAHGMNTVTLPLERDLHLCVKEGRALKEMEKKIAMCMEAGLTHPLVCGQYNQPHLPFDTRAKDFEMTAERASLVVEVTKYIQQQLSGKGYPEILYYAVDEPNAMHLRKTGAELYRLIKTVPGCRTIVTCVPDSLAAMKDYIDVRCYAKGVANPQLEGLAVTGEGATFWQYMSNYCHQPGSARRYNGWTMWAKRCTGTLVWHFNDFGNTGSIYNGTDGLSDYLFRWPALDGTSVSTIGWELTREGVDDYKYCWTLECAIKAAKGAGGAKAARAGKIEGELEAIRADALANAAAKDNQWTGATYDGLRRRVSDWIIELQ